MARYYFDYVDADGTKVDEVGLELSDDDAAKAEADRAMAEFVTEHLPNGIHMELSITVRTERAVLFQVMMNYDRRDV